MAFLIRRKTALTIVASLAIFLILPEGLLGAGPDKPLSSLPPPSAADLDPVDPGKWAAKSKSELEGDYDQMSRDLDLMEKRLNRLRGTTRLNQDQYREREILETLVDVKRRELTVLRRLIENAGRAPYFELPSTWGRYVSLDQYRGKQPVLVAFYRFDFSPESTTALAGLNEKGDTLTARGVAIVAVSADHPYSQKAFSEKLGLTFPLLSDRNKRVIKAYGIYDETKDTARPAYFLIDREGKVTWSQNATAEAPLHLDALVAILDKEN